MSEEKCYGIVYEIVNLVNGKIYIGQTTNMLNRRWGAHVYMAKKKLKSQPIHHAMNKYGVENFRCSEISKAYSKPELDNLEISIIDERKTRNRAYGYNLQTGGHNGKHSEESRKKMSKVQKGRRSTTKGIARSPETCQKISAAKKGIKRSPETCKKMSESRKGKKGTIPSSETRKKLSESHMGKTHSVESRKKMSDAKKGHVRSLETRKKLSEVNKGKIIPPETRKKMSEANKGKIRSLETCKKLSLARKGKPAHNRKAIIDSLGRIFSSVAAAKKELGISDISGVLSGKRKTAGGLTFKYYSEPKYEDSING